MRSIPWFVCVLFVGVAGCKLATSIGSSKAPSGGGGGGESKPVTVPDLTGMSRGDAEAALRKAGITASLEVTEQPCSDESLPHEHVCLQSPAAGAQSMSDLQVSVDVQSDAPDSSTPGVAGARYKMPDLIGLTPTEAKQKLAAAGFSAKDHFGVLSNSGCPRGGIVCETEPAPGTMTDTEFTKVLEVGDGGTGASEGYDLFDQ